MTAVIVAGALANKPVNGGEAWVRLSWIRGFQELGIDVRFVEELGGEEPDEAAVAWFRAMAARFGIAPVATLLHGGEAIAGPGMDELRDAAPEATLVNISGHVTNRDLLAAFRRRVFVDIDPGFTQIWHEAGLAGANVADHDLHFTIGEHIGSAGCSIPTAGIRWLPVRPPVVLGDWPRITPLDLDRFTTVASWRGAFGPVEHGGRRYGVKVHEFRKVLELVRRSGQRFEIALAIHPADAADRDALLEHGWELVEPERVAADPDVFRAYVQSSGAEFSVAQGVYVETGSGWFSDRTTRYLASGRPALVQDTGFSSLIGSGQGLVPFRTLDEAVAGAADIAARYDEHCAAARAVAEEHFASERVLARFCEQAGIG